jgi:hypothetical protein
MSLTYFENEDVVVTISDAGRDKCEAEQRHAQAEILMWATAGSLVTIAGLVVKQIVGAT